LGFSTVSLRWVDLVDLMALPSNVQHDFDGSPLPFFAPFPVPGCSGVNLFAQDFSQHRDGLFSNPCVFPPIALIFPVLRFLSGSCMSLTIVVPDVSPSKYWVLSLFHLKGGSPPIGPFPGIMGF